MFCKSSRKISWMARKGARRIRQSSKMDAKSFSRAVSSTIGEAMIHEITDENFESEVMDAGIPCVIEFTSDWCVLCKDMVPAFEKVAEELGDKVKFCSVDTGKQRKLGITFAVGSLPYVVYVANGEMTPLFDELVSADRLRERVQFMLDGGEVATTRPVNLAHLRR